jgi:hypothetical protein
VAVFGTLLMLFVIALGVCPDSFARVARAEREVETSSAFDMRPIKRQSPCGSHTSAMEARTAATGNEMRAEIERGTT